MVLSSIELIVYDFDGVMTDNKVYVNHNGNEFVQVNRADGFAVSELKKRKIKQVIISTETDPVVNNRAGKLGIDCINGVSHKAKELRHYCSKHNIDPRNVVYLGNDINDKKAMELVGWPVCPNDAEESIRKISKHILSKRGGEGVVRELLDLLSASRGGK